ncbi:hypothetical protein K2173_020751 [Erythroxylum novogranatense]|uniref:PLATZ transcription factor family protein n=1 Tax=Erythroxylum novogranatense TaxID=1862640 RepID=A0AAV8TLQ3_9ROSI|nr:hypothetical protein K2173_020751 [Erythroxylum novogranatense]
MLLPPWLESLLGTAFFNLCPRHQDAPRSECNLFCIDCNSDDMGDAFCFYCRSSTHKDHYVLQIRRSSYHDVVRVAEIQKVLDISGVQTYVINSARVLFLNERPQPKSSNSSTGKGSHLCEICGRSLLDTFRFCSLGCKLKEEEEELREGRSQQKDMTPTLPPPHSNSRRRKGIPHRAPFGS